MPNNTNAGAHRLSSYVSVGDRSALAAHHSPDLAALGSGVEIVLRALEGDSLHVALDPDLRVKQ